jgi:predicted transport protein
MSKTVIKKAIMPKKTKKVVNKKNQKTSKKVKSDTLDTPKKMTYPAWTMPKHLPEKDHKDLKRFYELFISGKIISAFSFASNFDTIVREAIPPDIWKQCGGSLTPKGEKELQKIEKKVVKHPSPPQGDNTDKKPEPVEIKFKSEKELEQLVLKNSKTFFGENALFFKDKNEARDERFPDKFLLDFTNVEKPKLYLIEVILPDQSFGQCFVRITHLFALLRNRKTQNDFIFKLYEIINSNKELKKELQTYIPKDVEIMEFLATLLDNRPLVLLITGGKKSELSLLVETYIETWGKMLKTIIIRKYDDEGETTYPMCPAFADLLKNDKSKPEVVKSTEEDHLNACSEMSRNIYNEIKSVLLKADNNIEFNAKKIYISLRKGKNLAFFHLRKKISLVVMNPEDDTRKLIKHHEIKSLPASVQKFWNGPSCTIILENMVKLDEIISLLKKMIVKSGK